MRIPTLAILAAACLLPCLQARAMEAAAWIEPDQIQGQTSSNWTNTSAGTVLDAGKLDADDGHDNSYWHTLVNPPATAPAEGLPASLAWLRFDFKNPRPVGRCLIWNCNQDKLTNRGFRHTQLFISADGTSFEAVKVGGQEVFEIPQAKGSPNEPVSLAVDLPAKPIKTVILLAKDNHGGNVHGLSGIRFLTPAEDVPEANLKVPAEMRATAFPFLYDEQAGWSRQVKVDFGGTPVFQAVEAQVTCGGETRTTTLGARSTGRLHLLLPLPAGRGVKRNAADKVKVTLKTPTWNREIETALVPVTPLPDLEEVIVTWKCHLDIGYTHSVPEVIEKYRGKDMDQILDMFEKTKDEPLSDRFRWMLPAWAAELVVDDKQTPQRRAKLEQAMKDGRLMWHAIPFTFESDAADLEELVRGLCYGSRLSRRFGFPLPTDAKQTDMPEQAWVLPTLLAHAGVKFLHIGANEGSKPGSELSKIPTLSWWEGADGSRVLLGYSASYQWGSIAPPGNWKHKTWLAFFVRGDNAGPPSPQQVESILAQARRNLPGVKVRFGRPSEFADAIIAEEKARPILPVIRADMPDTWCHGQMSTPPATITHRRAAPLLGTLGNLDTTLRSFGLAPEPVAPLLEDGYRNGGFYAEHTWGLNSFYFGGSALFQPTWRKRFEAGAYRKFEATYEYHMDYGRKAMADATSGLAPRLETLARAVKCDGPRVAAFNPLPWERDARIEAALPPGAGQVTGVTDAATGQAVAFEQEGARLRLDAKALPAGGYKTFALRVNSGEVAAPPAGALPADRTLKTPFFTAVFDLEKGGIASLVDNATGRELVAPGGHALGQFLHERFSLDEVTRFVHAYCRLASGSWVWADFGKAGMPGPKESPYAALTPKAWTAALKQGATADTVILRPADTLGLAKGYELAFTFPKGRACVDLAWRVDGKTADPIPEGGWLCLPFKVEQPAFRIGRVGGTIDPAKDISFGGNRSLITVDRGITVRSGETGSGMAVASADLPLWSLGKPGLWTYEPAYVPTQSEVFVNLYNNMWNTNYPLWVGGSWEAQLRLWPVTEGATEEQALFTPSWELRQEAVAAFADGPAGNLPAAQPGLSLSRKGVRATAFCPNPDGAGTVLRLWEQAGTSGDIAVTLPKGFKATKAKPVTLRGEKAGEDIEVKEGVFTCPLGAWAPGSFVLE